VSIGHYYPNSATIGRAVVSSFDIISSDANHEAREGFEWRVIYAELTFRDRITQWQGNRSRTLTFDYYTNEMVGGYGGNITEVGEVSDSIVTFNFNGQAHEGLFRSEVFVSGWEGYTPQAVYTFSFRFSALVPIGYDGLVFAWHNPGNTVNDVAESGETLGRRDISSNINDFIDGDTLFFRFSDI